jgi:hypothetical protein
MSFPRSILYILFILSKPVSLTARSRDEMGQRRSCLAPSAMREVS